MYFLVTLDYQRFLFNDASTADKFAAIAKSHKISDATVDVTIEYLTEEEAKKWLKD